MEIEKPRRGVREEYHPPSASTSLSRTPSFVMLSGTCSCGAATYYLQVGVGGASKTFFLWEVLEVRERALARASACIDGHIPHSMLIGNVTSRREMTVTDEEGWRIVDGGLRVTDDGFTRITEPWLLHPLLRCNLAAGRAYTVTKCIVHDLERNS
jgi:hypothetical protein